LLLHSGSKNFQDSGEDDERVEPDPDNNNHEQQQQHQQPQQQLNLIINTHNVINVVQSQNNSRS
jgi:hypothetical protein